MIIIKRFALASLLFAATAATGCNNTVSRLSIPANVVWNSFQTGFSTPYNDLTVEVHSNGNDKLIHGVVGPYEADVLNGQPHWFPYGYCVNPNPSPYATNSFLVQCPSTDLKACASICQTTGDTALYNPPGLTYNIVAIRYLAQLGVSIDRPGFQAGGISVKSASHGTIYSLSFSVNGSANNVNIAGGVSAGIVPTRIKAINPDDGLLAVDSYALFDFSPHDPNFDTATYGIDYNNPPPYNPTVACNPNPGDQFSPGDDQILIDTTKANIGQYTCGTLNINLALSRHLDDQEDCISDAVKMHCKDQGLVGQAREVCDAQQVQLCQTIFGHQNHSDDNDGCHNGD